MVLADYNIMFVHIKGKKNVLADAIFKLKTLNIYEEPLENPKAQVVNNIQLVVAEICATNMHTISTRMLCNILASQIHHGTKKSFKSVTMSAHSIAWYAA